MTSVSLYFKLHRPYILKNYKARDIDHIHCYEDSEANAASIDQLADECCLPLRKIYTIEKLLSNGDAQDMDTWGRLQSADYFYYMDENRGKYNHPFLSPQEAFQQYNNIVTDFELSLIKKGIQSQRKSYRELIPI